ncbi:MAG: RidA family protein [Anaerolineae bacterium]|nr:RidA family protein [Anaerolineae bacterium]
MSNERRIVSTPRAPAALGPYSQGVVAGGFVFTAMQIPLDPETGVLAPDDVQSQTRQVLQNVGAILEAAGSSLDRTVKVTLYLRDLADFAAVNEVYATFFPGEPPARAVVEVSHLPRGARIAAEAIALA